MARKKSQDTFPKLKKEISFFLIFIGVLLLVGGYFLYTTLKANEISLMGYERHVILGMPTLGLGFIHFMSGVLLATTSKKIFPIIGSLAATVLVLGYLGIIFVTTGKPPVNLLTAVFIAIPIVLWSRTTTFLKMRPE